MRLNMTGTSTARTIDCVNPRKFVRNTWEAYTALAPLPLGQKLINSPATQPVSTVRT